MAQFRGNFVRVNFVLVHSDVPGNLANVPTPGWYIDDIRIGEPYTQAGTMVVKNLQPSSRYQDKSPDGYGLLYTDTFVPGSSSLTYSFRDSQTGTIVTDKYGYKLSDLTGPVIQLWNIDVDTYPYIDMEIDFNSGQDRLSSPIFYGYALGSEVGIRFNDLTNYRGLNIINGDYSFVNDTAQPESLFLSLIHI